MRLIVNGHRYTTTSTTTTTTAAGLTIVDSTSNTSTNQNTSMSLTGLPAGCLLVASFASADDKNLATDVTVGGTSLTWTKRSENATDGTCGMVEIWTATFTAGGNVTVTGAWAGGTTNYSSAALYAITGAETTPGGNAANETDGTAPSMSLTTTRANSLIFAASSDWNAQPGSPTYRITSTTKLDDYVSGQYHGYHYYASVTTATSYTVGISSPTGQASGSCCFEIRTP